MNEIKRAGYTALSFFISFLISFFGIEQPSTNRYVYIIHHTKCTVKKNVKELGIVSILFFRTNIEQ